MNRTTNLVCSIIEGVILIFLFIVELTNIYWSYTLFAHSNPLVLCIVLACIITLIVLVILDMKRPKSNRRLVITILISAIGFVMLLSFYGVDYVSYFARRIASRFHIYGAGQEITWLEILSPIFLIILSVIKLKAPAKPPASIKQTPVSIKPNQTDIVNKLTEYKELLDMGAITEEEFDAKKKQLLGL